MAATLTHTDLYSPFERKRIARIVFSLFLLSLVWSFFSNTLLHQLCRPVIKYPYVDPTYWAMNWLRIPEMITDNYLLAWIFDGLLISSCVLSLLFPDKRIFVWSLIILFFIYFITYNTYGVWHTGNKIGLLLIAIPFAVRDNKSFNYLWQGLRYFLLFSFSCAFLWKFFRFSWLYADEGILIMKKNAAAYLYFKPNTWLAHLYEWFLQHPGLLQFLYIAGVVLEGVFIIGFFTRKADRYLFILSILLVLGFWFMAEAHFFELLILNLTLIPPHFIRRYSHYTSSGLKTSQQQ